LDKPRWLVLNKADLMFEDEARARAEEIVAGLGWEQPWFLVSALGREGTWPIMLEVQAFFDRLRADALDEASAAGTPPAGYDAGSAGADAGASGLPRAPGAGRTTPGAGRVFRHSPQPGRWAGACRIRQRP